MAIAGAVDGEVVHRSLANATECANQREIEGDNETTLTFFRFPAEVRNAIYHELISWHAEKRHGRDLLDHPAITKVNRQARTEALPLYFGIGACLWIRTGSSNGWVEAVQRLIGLLTGGPDGLPGSNSTLRYVTVLELIFATRDSAGAYKVRFTDDDHATMEQVEEAESIDGPDVEKEQDEEVEPLDEPDFMTKPDEEADFMDGYDTPYEPVGFETVRVGSPGMDWTDAEAVQLACFNGWDEFRGTLMDRHLENPTFPAPDEAAIEEAMDAMCVVAAACPRLTGSVSIADHSGFAETGWKQMPDE